MAIKKILLSLLLILVTSSSNALYVKAQESIDLINIEASVAKELLPKDLSEKTTAVKELNSLIIEGDESQIKRLKNFLVLIDKPFKQIELEVKIIELKTSALRDLRVFKDSISSRGGQQIGVVTTSTLIGDPLVTGTKQAGNTLGTSIGRDSFLNNTGFLIGKIKGLNIFDFSLEEWDIFNRQLSFLESKGIAQVHAYPKLVTISGRTAKISINEDSNLILGAAQGVGQRNEEGGNTGLVIGVASTQTIGTIMAGTNLLITPTVGKNELITTDIKVEVSENSISRAFQNGVSVPAATFRRQIDTDVQVSNGKTIAIGGLVTKNENVVRRGLPFITSIPFVGDLFSNRTRQRDKSELVILITPKILTQENITTLKETNLPKIEDKLMKKEFFEAEDKPRKKSKWWHLGRW